jgi:hypothetical protein
MLSSTLAAKLGVDKSTASRTADIVEALRDLVAALQKMPPTSGDQEP